MAAACVNSAKGDYVSTLEASGQHVTYIDLCSEGPSHRPTWYCRAICNNTTVLGSGPSKEKAKQAAAKAILDQAIYGKTPLDGKNQKSVTHLNNICQSRKLPYPSYKVEIIVGQMKTSHTGNSLSKASEGAAKAMLLKIEAKPKPSIDFTKMSSPRKPPAATQGQIKSSNTIQSPDPSQGVFHISNYKATKPGLLWSQVVSAREQDTTSFATELSYGGLDQISLNSNSSFWEQHYPSRQDSFISGAESNGNHSSSSLWQGGSLWSPVNFEPGPSPLLGNAAETRLSDSSDDTIKLSSSFWSDFIQRPVESEMVAKSEAELRQELTSDRGLNRAVNLASFMSCKSLQQVLMAAPEDYIKKLHKVANEKSATVSFIELEEKSSDGEFQCVLQVSTLPTSVCLGSGPTLKSAQNDAARVALKYMDLFK